MIFFTCNDPVNGIFESQVIDVCRYLKENHGVSIRLISMFPASAYSEQSGKLRISSPDSIALRSVFPLRLNNLNSMILRRVLPEQAENVWARGVFACKIALKLKQSGKVRKVIYDGRGAVAEEFREYMDPSAFRRMRNAEKTCVLQSDYRCAVSDELVSYWRSEFGYAGETHAVIPTTLNSAAATPDFSSGHRQKIRESLGFSAQDVVFVFSGGSADWQSFYLLGNLINKHFPGNPDYKLLLLLPDHATGPVLNPVLMERVVRKHVLPAEVIPILTACDYGLLVREPSVTNKVSAPTKYAEYLYAGLQVIISDGVGDYSVLTKRRNTGYTTGDLPANLFRASEARREELKNTALELFSKKSERIQQAYRKLLNAVGEL
ncbi:MAG: hypothetical protein IT233_10400 [Bacteroidia bacterium]|nr:hypothetical protein [Bacteroidia bacterium]